MSDLADAVREFLGYAADWRRGYVWTASLRAALAKHEAEATREPVVWTGEATPMTPDEKEAQRRSFAFGNTNIDNERITRATIDEAAANLKKKTDAAGSMLYPEGGAQGEELSPTRATTESGCPDGAGPAMRPMLRRRGRSRA